MSVPERRPFLLWLIAFICILTVLSGVWSNTLFISGRAPLAPKMQSYVDSWTMVDRIVPFLNTILLLVAAVALIRQHRSAVRLFGACFVLTVAVSIVHALTTSWFETMGGTGVISVLFNWIFYAFLWWYSARIQRQGVLA